MDIQKLDTLLLLMNEQEEHKIVTPDMAESFIPKPDYIDYASKLISDRHAILLDKNSCFLMLTSRGGEFIRGGGYTRDKERSMQFNKKKHKLAWMIAVLLTCLLIFVLLAAIFYYFQKA